MKMRNVRNCWWESKAVPPPRTRRWGLTELRIPVRPGTSGARHIPQELNPGSVSETHWPRLQPVSTSQQRGQPQCPSAEGGTDRMWPVHCRGSHQPCKGGRG